MTNQATAVVLGLALCCCVVAARRGGGVGDLPTVPSLNVTQYLGLWYQMYTDPFNAIFEGNPYCATAKYGLNANGTVSVRNIDRSGGYDGVRQEVEGYAYQVDPTTYPGRLAVVFPFNPVPGPYWIIKLGPVVGGEYQYSVVSDDFKLSLFVLTRDVKVFKAQYQTEIREYLQEMGYDGLLDNATVVPQGPQCQYS